MGSGRKYDSYDAYVRHLKNGIGIGEYEEYSPWLRVQDVRESKATGDKINGIKVKRVYHTLSPNESNFFYLAEFDNDVLDIREQFPLLPLTLTTAIAKHLGVKHPQVPFVTGGMLNLMTTDFLLTTKTGYVAVSVKPPNEFDINSKNLKRTLEKIEIERVFWELLGVEFKLFAPDEESKIKAGNISWATDPVRNKLFIPEFQVDSLAQIITLGEHDYALLVDKISYILGFEPVMAANALKLLIAKKVIEVDLTRNFLHSGIIEINTLSEQGDTSVSNIA
ncbi:Tn7 transposase TnsA N-terminal domain-containing protein [Endozoicomonas sp. G2_1]|uniref:TnsA endonuclease N-terminal domain-containing protein n=1 Tax=Endozoicomonas sp. G2_1 TaxID=2821091 RepID=UPI001ADCE90F|nr:TnsA endonuclease N-terminal domain-containing protein [Endozoicomonas sp. G2_1]MBO9489853.1 Tn7 transposase TnsA N-terminal domain-containing protein [Endozoicomonas sp. G2_1]